MLAGIGIGGGGVGGGPRAGLGGPPDLAPGVLRLRGDDGRLERGVPGPGAPSLPFRPGLPAGKLLGEAELVAALEDQADEHVEHLARGDRAVEPRARLRQERCSFSCPLASDDQPAEDPAQGHGQRGERDQDHDPDRDRVVGRCPGGTLPSGLAGRDQMLQASRLLADAVDEPLAEDGRGVGPRRGGVGAHLLDDTRDVGAQIGAGGGCQRSGLGGVGAVAGGGSPQSAGRGGHLRTSGALGRQEQRLAGDHVAAQAGLGVDDEALDADRRLEVAPGAQSGVRAPPEVDDVGQQQRDANRDRDRAREDHGKHPCDEPGPCPHGHILAISAPAGPEASRRSSGRTPGRRWARG